MPVLKNTPRYLDKDKEYRLLDEQSMTDALNVRGVYNEGNDYLLLKNVLGNVLKSYTFPTGSNTCIGAIQEVDKNNLYYFVYNSNGNHSIVRYNCVTGIITKVLQSNKLGFNLDYLIQGYAVAGLEPSISLLYFTDGFNPPRKINVERAIEQSRGNYGDGYDVFFNTYFDYYTDQVKHPPAFGPEFDFGLDPEIKYNNISDKSFQFRYRYIYDDGEASSFSPYSALAVSADQSSSAFYSDNISSKSFNYIDVVIKNGKYNVEKIEVAFRMGNDGGLRLIETIDNNPSQQETVIRFYNNGAYESIADRDSLKLYDAVPITAKTQNIKNNRNFWGNVVDTYLPLTEAETAGGQTLTPRYYFKPEFGSNNIPCTTLAGQISNFLFNFTGMSFKPGTLVNTEVSVDVSWQSFTGAQRKYVTYRASYIVKDGDTIADIISALVIIYNNQNTTSNRVLFNVSANSNSGVGLSVSVEFKGRLYIFGGTAVFSTGYIGEYIEEPVNSMSFKSGANHEFGVVYYDRANRSNTVSKAGSSYVKFFSERLNDTFRGEELLGRTHIDWTLNWTPPSWATHYQWVYTKNTTIDDFIQYACLAAYEPINPNNKIYLSMRSLEGHYDSYVDSTSAKITYSFVEGDRLRVMRYKDPGSLDMVSPSGYFDFRILGYEYLAQDVETNPIFPIGASSDDEKTQASGWFLIIEKPTGLGFSVVDSTSLWYNNDYGAVFEIYRRFEETNNNVYYEFSEENEIIDAGLSTRRHAGSLRNQGESISYDVSAIGITDANYAALDAGYSNIKLVAGDIVKFTGTNAPAGEFTIVYFRYDEDNDTWYVYFEEDVVVPGLPGPDITIELVKKPAAGIFENGDVWFRSRRIKYNNDISIANFYTDLVEDYSFNDFYKSNYGNFGRVNGYTPYNVIDKKVSTIYYSDPIQMGSSYNGLSSVYLSEAPYIDLDRTKNSIQKIVPLNESLIVYQENNVINLPLSRNIIELADGGQMLTVSQNILGEPRYYNGNYGIGTNPESFAEFNGKHYFVDIQAGAVLRLGGDGISVISDYGMNSFFQGKARKYSSEVSNVKIFGGFDVEHEEYIISVGDNSAYLITSNELQSTTAFQNVISEDPNYTFTGNTVIGTASYDRYALNTEPRPMNDIDDSISLSGYPIVMSETLSESGNIYVPESVIGGGVQPVLMVISMSDGNDLLLGGDLDPSNGDVTIPQGELGLQQQSSIDGFTVSFSEPSNKWVSFYSYKPEFMSYIGTDFVSFNNGQLYIHNRNENRSNFYGTQYGSVVEYVANKEPSVVKIYEATSLEGTHAWSSEMDTPLNGTEIASSLFSEKEGAFYSYIPTSTSGTTDSNVLGVGVIQSINSNSLRISGFNSNNSELFIGDSIYNGTDLVGVVIGFIGYDTITLASVSNVSVGDFVHAIKTQSIDGDFIRGPYLKNRLSITTTQNVELYASNLYVKKSYVHHS